MLPPNPFSSYRAATACPGQRSPSEGNKCIEVCIAASACREMMGLWLRSPTFGASGRLVRNPTSIRRGDAGLRPYSYCPQGNEITSPVRNGEIRQPAPLSPECVEGKFCELRVDSVLTADCDDGAPGIVDA